MSGLPLEGLIPWPWLLALVETLWIVGMGSWLILERRSPTATLAWILALAAIPILGVPVYLLLGPRRFHRKKTRMAIARRACECFREPSAGNISAVRGARRQLIEMASRIGIAPALPARSIALYTDGDACHEAIVSAIRSAKHHVHAEYYIFKDDRTGTKLRDALLERAKAGVQVRLLLDAAGCLGLPARFLEPLEAAGAQVMRFNPLRLGRQTPNFRTHRKIVVCDGLVGFTGGMNACDHASRSARGAEAWRDTHVRLEGRAVHGLQLTFFENWVFSAGHELAQETEAAAVDRQAYFPGDDGDASRLVQVVASGPDHEPYAIHALYFAALAAARERAWLTTPYFVPDEPLLTALKTAAWRGVDVRLIVPSATDAFLVDAASTTYHDELVEAGVKLFVYGPPMIHAKTAVIDHDLAIVGTANLDNRSFRLNFELVAAIHDTPVADELARAFEEDLGRCRPVVPGGRQRLPRRLLTSAARLFAPLL